jgi:predicted short-subunit dehydrogenase-like oxidoreductase (DUF2520 family)
MGGASKPLLHLIGAGRAGIALVRLLHGAGHDVGCVASRTFESAQTAARAIGAGAPSTDAAAAFGDGAITLLGLPEHALAPVCEEVASRMPARLSAIALHLSGSLPAEVLSPLRARGVAVGSLHPIAAFADRGRPPDSLDGVSFDVDGDPGARAAAADLARELGGRVIELGPDGKALFHAAACVASNALVALLDLAFRLAELAGASPLAARGAMAALAQSTLENLARAGSPAALTGPIERGEAAVIERHLEAIARRAPEERARYVELARATLKIARRKGTLSPEQAAALARLLRAGGA